jgi:uncharacterized protein (TIGR03000 family)
MGKQQYLGHAWVLAAAAALLAPAAGQAQTVIFGAPLFGRPPVTLGSPLGGYGGYGWPGYGGFGWPGYGGYGWPGYGGYGLPGYGGYGGAFSAPFAGYSYSYMNTAPYVGLPTYQPLTGYGFGTGSYGFTTGLPPTTAYGSGYPRMRSTNYPPWTAYTAGGLDGLPASSLTGSAAFRQTTYPELYVGAPGPGASLGSFAPVAYASAVCGGLTYAPVAYSPAGYVATAAAAFGPPTRVRQSNYQADTAAGPAVYAPGLAPRRAQVDVRLPSAGAEVWFDGVKMQLAGKTRRFFTPPLEPGSKYTYTVRARWLANGQTRQQTRNVYLRAGDVLDVAFPAPSGKQ